MIWVAFPGLAANWDSKMKIDICSRLRNRLKKQDSFFLLSILLLLPLTIAGCAFQTARSYAWLPDAQTENAGVYIKQCGVCHSPPHPERENATAWKGMVAVMDKRRKERGYPPLTETERKKVMTYLDAHAR